jgi:uncharacterized phage protein gp47/JayE
MKTIPTITEIRDQILDDIEGASTSYPLLPKAAWIILATAMAGAQYLLYRFGLWLYYQIFTGSMDDDALAARGSEYGITRTPAQKWRGTATATGTDDTVIPAGSLWQKAGYVYTNLTAQTISGGTATLSLESLEAGDDVDLDVSDEVKIVTPQTGVDEVATIATDTQAGEDIESLSDYRARILFQQRNKPQGGAIPDFISWSTEVAGIAEAFIDRPSPGYVNVYPLTDDPDPANRVPGAPKLTEVEDHINDDHTYPFGRQATALAMTELDFDIDIANLSPNTAAMKAAIETALDTYMFARRPQQYSDELTPLDKVSAAEITAEAINAGATNATVTLKNAGGGDITSSGYELDINELSVLRTLAWV